MNGLGFSIWGLGRSAPFAGALQVCRRAVGLESRICVWVYGTLGASSRNLGLHRTSQYRGPTAVEEEGIDTTKLVA